VRLDLGRLRDDARLGRLSMRVARLVALMVLVSLGYVLLIRCSDDDQYSEARLTGVIEDVMDAADVEVDRNYIAGYARKSAPDCREVPEDDRWFVIQTGQILSDRQSQDRVYDGVLAYLEGDDFDVERYVSPHPEAEVVGLRGVRDDLVVKVTVSGDGNSHIRVAAGPCAERVNVFSDDRYRRVE